MKKTFFLFFVLQVLVTFGQESVLKLKIANNTTAFATASPAMTGANEMTTSYRIALDDNGYAEFALPMYADASFFRLTVGQFETILFLEKNKETLVELDAANPDATLHFGKDGANNNSFLSNFIRRNPTSDNEWRTGLLYFYAPKNLEQAADTRTAVQHSNIVREKLTAQILELNNAKATLSPVLYEFLNTTARADADVARIAWLAQNRNRQTPAAMQANTTSLGITAPLLTDMEAKFEHPVYANYLRAWLCSRVWLRGVAEATQPKTWYETAETTLKGRPKCALQAEIINHAVFEMGDKTFAPQVFAEYQQGCAYPDLIQSITDTYGDDVRFVEHAAAPQLTFRSTDGKTHTLDEYRGKVIYLSFWASWCKPCLAGFQKSATLRKELEAAGIVLLNISIDEKEDAYDAARTRQELVGIVGLATDIPETQHLYALSTLPAYYIINKSGQFTYLSAGDSRNIVEEFRKLTRQ